MKQKYIIVVSLLVVFLAVTCSGCTKENVEGEDVSYLASIYSTESISMDDNCLTIEVQADSLAIYNIDSDSWDSVTTSEISFELSENCEWFICSPLALHEDYSDAIESDKDEIMQVLIDELEAKTIAEEKGEPYYTSMSVMVKVIDGKIVKICQISA